MKKNKTLIITDNTYACEVALELNKLYGDVSVCQSPNGSLKGIERIDVKKHAALIASTYELVLSIHCKQLFPPELVDGTRCINIHPGLNPHNRGWFPQVFSIINGLPSGVTIHEIDNELDHGPIIIQKEYNIKSWDTSSSSYEEIMKIERELILDNFISIRDHKYSTTTPASEGNINYKRDFDKIKKINLDQHGTYRELINHLRALTHKNYRNAYFIDDSGKKIFISIQLDAVE